MNTTNADQQAILREILLHPEDDQIRLVYADYLEEYGGEEDRARSSEIHYQLWNKIAKSAIRMGDNYLTHTLWKLQRWTAPLNLHVNTEVIWERGFISEIRCTLEEFLRIAEELFSTHPVERVELVDRKPAPRGNWYGWWDRDTLREGIKFEDGYPADEDLPKSLWDALPKFHDRESIWWRWYSSEEKANQALSDACCLYGRKAAKLIP